MSLRRRCPRIHGNSVCGHSLARMTFILFITAAAFQLHSTAALSITSGGGHFSITTSRVELCAPPFSSICGAGGHASAAAAAANSFPAGAQSVIRVWTLPLFSFDTQRPPSAPSWSIACMPAFPLPSAAAASAASSPLDFPEDDSSIAFDCNLHASIAEAGGGASDGSTALAVSLQGLARCPHSIFPPFCYLRSHRCIRLHSLP
jgi:hypothetical protein